MKTRIALAVALLLTGCAAVPQQANPDYSLVDPSRTDMVRYQADFEDCAKLAHQADVGASAAGAGVVGAVIGGIAGALICGRSCAAWGAGLLGGSGVARGANAAAFDQNVTLRNCLAGRGYNIIR